MNNIRPQRHRTAKFFAIRQILGISVSPNGNTVAFITNTDGLPNIWTIPISGGWASQVTLAEDAVKNIYYTPKNNNIVFQSDFSGNENLQLYMVSDKGGDIKYITPSHKDAQVFLSTFSKKGDKILFVSNKRDPRYFDTYTYEIKTGKEECIRTLSAKNAEMAADWSSDQKYIVYEKFYDNSNQDLILFDTVNNQTKNITEHNGTMKNLSPVFSRKNDKIYFLTDSENEFTFIKCFNIKTGELSNIAGEKWDIISFKFSDSEKFIIYAVNENGVTKLKKKILSSGKTKTLKIPRGNINSFTITPDEKKIVYIYDGPQNPNDIFVYDIKGDKSKQITFSMIGGIPKKDFIEPTLVKYKSFDGLEISAWLYMPKCLKKNASNPAVVWAHGGPEWQEKNLFSKYHQILANKGFIVISPNFRGSTGYGKTFQRKIYKDWGGAELQDVLGSREYLVTEGYADKNNIAIVGGSFGGFMTLTCITKAPDLWKCAVDIFGPSNMITFLETVPEHWKPGTNELVGDPVKDRQMLMERSPINYVDNILSPLLIIQGKHDPRVVQAESDQMVEKLKSQNKDVEYFVFEDEGHGFLKVSNNIKAWDMIGKFLDKHLN